MKSQTITIVGGGITGLSAAFFAQRAMPDAQITVLESSELWGGVLQTESTEGYLIEHSADMFTTDPESAIQICEHLGKTDELLQTIPIDDRAYVATEDIDFRRKSRSLPMIGFRMRVYFPLPRVDLVTRFMRL